LNNGRGEVRNESSKLLEICIATSKSRAIGYLCPMSLRPD
jgi:hypothetical protein